MSKSDQKKAGFELDVVDLSSLSIPPQKTETETEDPDGPRDIPPPEKEPPESSDPSVRAPSASVQKPARAVFPLIWTVPVVLLVLAGLAYFLFFHSKPLPLTENKAIPPGFNRSVIALAESVETMEKQLYQFDTMTNRINSKQKISTILESMDSLERHLARFASLKQEFVGHVARYRSELQKENNPALLQTAAFYQGTEDHAFWTALTELVEVQRRYLNYFFNNYEKIVRKQQPQIYTYEKYYLEFSRALEKYNLATAAANRAIQPLIRKHPETRKLLLIKKGAAIFQID